MTDSDYEFDHEKDLWVPGRRRFMFLGALGSVAAALGLSSSSVIPRAVLPPKMVPTAFQAPGSTVWQVDLAPSPDSAAFWFVDTGYKLVQGFDEQERLNATRSWWLETRKLVVAKPNSIYEASLGYSRKGEKA